MRLKDHSRSKRTCGDSAEEEELKAKQMVRKKMKCSINKTSSEESCGEEYSAEEEGPCNKEVRAKKMAQKKNKRSKEMTSFKESPGDEVETKRKKNVRNRGCSTFDKTQAGMIKAFITTGRLPTGQKIPRGWLEKSYITFDPTRSSVYPAAYCFLEFQRGDSKINKKYDIGTRPIAAKKVSLISKEKHGNSRPEAPIDVAKFIRQADTGRFTNKFIRRNYDHSPKCLICKKKGSGTGHNRLRGCCFCANSNHIQCIEKKLPVVRPKDHEDFLCITCMRDVRCRLKRAEKRTKVRAKVREVEKAVLSQPFPILVPGMAFDTFLGVVQGKFFPGIQCVYILFFCIWKSYACSQNSVWFLMFSC